MEKEKSRQKQLHKRKFHAIMGFAISFVLLCFASGVLFAKYYAGSSNKGVATASSLYFSSNVLRNIGNATGNLDDSSYPIIYNTEAWDGTGACNLDVQIRNYQNQLLYNDQNLDITYDITFELTEESDNGIYKVFDGTDTFDITGGHTFKNVTLDGGVAKTDTYKISVTRPDEQKENTTYRSVGIRVTAIPVSPSYVTSSASLGGILYASMVSVQYKLDYNFDKVKSVDSFSGFPCTITYTPGEDNVAHEVKITWNNKLEIDQYNKYYLQAKAAGSLQVTDDSSYIILTMEPYSAVDVTFYRTSNFNDSRDSLSDCINLEDMTLQETVNSSEGSE